MTKLFLSLNDAVLVATKKFGIDPLLAEQEFEQKCYITDNQYVIGYYDGLDDAIKAIEHKQERSRKNDKDIHSHYRRFFKKCRTGY